MSEALYSQTNAPTESSISLPSLLDARPDPRQTEAGSHTYERVPDAEEYLHRKPQTPSTRLHLEPLKYATVPSGESDRAGGSSYGPIPREGLNDGESGVQPTLRDTKSSSCKEGSEQGARTLTNTGHHRWSSLMLDVILCLFPIAFVVVATLALSLHDAPRSPSGDRVQSYTFLAPTVFPIVYAAILGRTLRRIGLYMAEKGSTIGTLERITGCQSLFSAIERQYSLRHIDALGVLILLVWLLSPVGGQSSLRLLSYHPQTVFSNTTAWYYPMQGYIWASLRGFDAAFRFHHISVTYMAALQSSSQTLNSSMDMWGNLKIPDIRYMAGYQTNTSIGIWQRIDNDTNLTYTSLLGVPVFGVATSGNSTFNITSHYWSVDCEEPSRNDSLTPWSSSEPEMSTYALATFNESFEAGVRTVYSSRKGLTGGSNTTMTRNGTSPGNSAMPANSSFTTHVVSATCYARPVLVETCIACWDTTCRAQAIRELDWRHRDPQIQNQRLILYSNYTKLLRDMPLADKANGGGAATQSQLTESFIAGQMLYAGYITNRDGNWADIEKLSKGAMSLRLQQAINTYWDASISNIFRSLVHVPDEKPPSVCLVRQEECDSRALTWNVTAFESAKHSGEKYACSSGYAVITIAISCLLFLAAVLSLLLGVVTTAPDILGFVSTAARNSIYFSDRVPSHFDGLEATRALRDVAVMIGDVAGGKEVGHVAFVSWERGPRRLVRERLYS